MFNKIFLSYFKIGSEEIQKFIVTYDEISKLFNEKTKALDKKLTKNKNKANQS